MKSNSKEMNAYIEGYHDCLNDTQDILDFMDIEQESIAENTVLDLAVAFAQYVMMRSFNFDDLKVKQALITVANELLHETIAGLEEYENEESE